MKIAIFDCRLAMVGRERSLRANDLRCYLTASNKSYEVTAQAHVNFGDYIDTRWSEEEAAIKGGAAAYDVIILHVGDDQTLAKKSLGEAYQDKYVVCFGGGGIPTECRRDCHENRMHCYIREDIGTADTWPEFWKKRILEYIRLLEQGKPDDAWNLIMDYNPELEKELDELTAALRKLVNSGNPTQGDFEKLSNNRDNKLMKAYQWREKQLRGIRQ